VILIEELDIPVATTFAGAVMKIFPLDARADESSSFAEKLPLQPKRKRHSSPSVRFAFH